MSELDISELTTFVQRAITVVSQSADLRRHFEGFAAWLETREKIWNNKKWRVALIGITSSGKSTLVNALCDDKLLPERVRPSSNTLVLCQRGDEAKGIVYFEDGNEKILHGKNIHKHLAELTDEVNNPGNELGVKEIELYWPKFRLAADVTLVDTPGLDAFSLERHEELTMQLLLPSVDVVVFLTTAKANADGRIKHYLELIEENDKPVVLVQNMIDSIEPKLGVNGAIVKDRAEVAKEHIARLRRLIKESLKNSETVPIIQVSAHWALEGKAEDSRIPDLVAATEQHIRALKPTVVLGRYRQLYAELDRQIKREEIALSGKPVSAKKITDDKRWLTVFDTHVKELAGRLATSLEDAVRDAESQSNSLSAEASNMSKNEVEKANALIERVNAWSEGIPLTLSAAVKEFQKKSRKYAGKLNISSEDMSVELPRSPVMRQLRPPVIEKPEEYTVKKQGAWSAVKRFFGRSTGWETRVRYRNVVDVSELYSIIHQHARREIIWMKEAGKTVLQNASGVVGKLIDELKRRYRELEEVRQAEHSADSRRDAVEKLVAINREIAKTHLSQEISEISVAGAEVGLTYKMKTVEVPVYLSSLLQLTSMLSRKSRIALRNYVVNRGADIQTMTAGRCLIWGQDRESLESFITRYWSDVMQCSKGSRKCYGRINDAKDFKEVAVALEHPLDHCNVADVKDALSSFLSKPATVMLILDTEQPGSTMNHLMRSDIISLISREHSVVLVVQAMRGLRNSGPKKLAESLIVLREMADKIKLNPSSIMVNDNDIVMSVLADRLVLEGHALTTLRDENRWKEDFLKAFKTDIKFVGQVIREWRELARMEARA